MPRDRGDKDFRFAAYEIDLGRHELRHSGERVAIEPQVFDLLVHLVRNRDRIVSKEELFDTIWQGRIVSDAALSSRIAAARRAIGDSGNDQVLIRTIQKRGFRFVGEIEDAPLPVTNDAGPIQFTPSPAEPDVRPAPAVQADGGATLAVKLPPVRKASIAVLPFDNLSSDPENDYFSHGMMEDLIRLLARNRWLTVISRHSAVAFMGRKVDVREVREALSVHYALVGSIRRSNESVRITAELVCASDATQLWSESYSVSLADIFDIQEEMARQIAATIEPELAKVEQRAAARKLPSNLGAWECYQRGLWHLWQFTSEGFDKAEHFFRRAIEIDPGLARAHAGLGYVDVQRTLYDEPPDRPARLDAAFLSARAAVALDERDCLCHFVLGRALCLLRRNEEATAALDLAIELNPSFAQAYFAQGFNRLWSGHPIEAEALLDRATVLSPRDAHVWSFHHVRAWARFSLGEFDAAVRFARQAARQPNASYRAFATLAASLGALGKDEAEMGLAAAELLKRKPDYSGALARKELFFCNDGAFIERYVAGLGAAGVPAES